MRQSGSGVARIWRQGAQRVWGTESSPGSRGRAPGVGIGARSPIPERYSILRIFSCQAMHNFVYLSKVHEPLVKHEKNLGCSACLFADLSSTGN